MLVFVLFHLMGIGKTEGSRCALPGMSGRKPKRVRNCVVCGVFNSVQPSILYATGELERFKALLLLSQAVLIAIGLHSS